MPDNPVSAKEYSQIWLDRVWNEGNEQAIRELMSPDCRMGGLPMPPDSSPIEAFIVLHRSFQAAFSNIRMEILDILGEGECVIGQALFRAIHRFTGKAVEIPFSFWAQWQEAQMIAARNILDYSPMLLELGILTADQLQSIFIVPGDASPISGVVSDPLSEPGGADIPFIAKNFPTEISDPNGPDPHTAA